MEEEIVLENSEPQIKEGPTRNSLQKTAMSALYVVLTYVDMGAEIPLEEIVSGVANLPYAEVDPFVKEICLQAIKHYDEAVLALESKMNKWTFARRNRVEQAILLQAYVHYLYVEPEVEKGVVIDVAVKLSKVFTGGNDYRFVNAVLDKALVRP